MNQNRLWPRILLSHTDTSLAKASFGYRNGYSPHPFYLQQLGKNRLWRPLFVCSQFAVITVDYGVRSGLLEIPKHLENVGEDE